MSSVLGAMPPGVSVAIVLLLPFGKDTVHGVLGSRDNRNLKPGQEVEEHRKSC